MLCKKELLVNVMWVLLSFIWLQQIFNMNVHPIAVLTENGTMGEINGMCRFVVAGE